MAAAPRWVMLYRNINGSGSISTAAADADAKTTAASCTSSGLLFSVSFSIAPPPAFSRLHHTLLAVPGGGRSTPSSDDDDDNNKDTKDLLYLEIVAAHDDSVLLQCTLPQPGFSSRDTLEYFLYEAAGAAAAGGRTPPPTLSLLPGCYVSNQFERDQDARHVPTRRDEARNLSFPNNTGVLRRGGGDGEVLVAQLEVGYGDDSGTAELCLLRPGHDDDWVLKRLPIVRHDGEAGEAAGEVQVQQHSTMVIDATVPVGSRFMCWVDYLAGGFLLCDMAAAAAEEENSNPKLRYVLLPAVPPPRTHHRRRPNLEYCQKLADAGARALKFVSVAPRCCCGGPGQTTCERSSFAFNVTTWTLILSSMEEEEEPMVWVKDGVLDCDELWQLPGYGGLPRVPLRHPVVSSEDPDIVCFTVCGDADETVWMVEINTKSKALLSVVRSDMEYYTWSNFLPAKLRW